MYRLAFVVFILGTQIGLRHQSETCEPRPDYWFAERYEFGPVNLPQSIKLDQSPPNVAQGYFQIRNQSEFPIYVLPIDARPSLVATTAPSISGDGLSDEQSPEEILFLDRAPELATFVIDAGESLQLDNANFPILIPYIEERNVLDFGRPAFIYVPLTQRGEFLLVYDDQLAKVPFTISYAINENFTPEVCDEEINPITQQAVAFDEESNNSILISTIAFGVILLVTVGAVFLVRKLATGASNDKSAK